MIRVAGLLVTTIFLTACASTKVEEFQTPGGVSVKKVKCNMDSQKCMAEASKSCNGGSYQVLDSESHSGGTLADIMPGPVTWYSMAYVCGPSDGRMPTFAFQGQQYAPAPVVVNPVNPAPAYRPMRTTNCNTIGNTVNCTSW